MTADFKFEGDFFKEMKADLKWLNKGHKTEVLLTFLCGLQIVLKQNYDCFCFEAITAFFKVPLCPSFKTVACSSSRW